MPPKDKNDKTTKESTSKTTLDATGSKTVLQTSQESVPKSTQDSVPKSTKDSVPKSTKDPGAKSSSTRVSKTTLVSTGSSTGKDKYEDFFEQTGGGTEKVKYEDAFEQTGHGFFSYLVTLACSLVFIYSILEMVGIAYVITPAESDLRLSVSQTSWINASVFLGMMTTSIPWGLMGDKFGRRMVMLPTLILTVCASFISSLCTSFWLLFVFRLITGIMISAPSALVLVYLGELQDAKHRDRSLSIAISTAQFSLSIIPALAWAIIPLEFSFQLLHVTVHSWRVYMWFWGVVGLVGAGIICALPESPRYVFATKGPTKALPILAKIYAWNFKTTATTFPVRSLCAESFVHKTSVHEELVTIMKPPLRRCVFLTHLVMFNCFLLSNGLYIWVPDFLNAALAKTGQSINMCKLIHIQYFAAKREEYLNYTSYTTEFESSTGKVDWKVYPTFIVLELVFLIPFILVVIYIDKVSKVWLCAIIMWVSTVALIMCTVVPQCVVSVFFLLLGLACGCCACILTALVADAFPTSLRGLATCTMFMLGQFGAVIGTKLVAYMEGWACYVIFGVVGAVCAAGSWALVLLWPNIHDVREKMESKNFAY